MIYRIRVGQPKLEAFAKCGKTPNWGLVGKLILDAGESGQPRKYTSFQEVVAWIDDRNRNEYWNYEAVYQDSNEEWKPIEQAPISKDSNPVNDHVCPACGNNKCSRSEIKCWRCGNKL